MASLTRSSGKTNTKTFGKPAVNICCELGFFIQFSKSGHCFNSQSSIKGY